MHDATDAVRSAALLHAIGRNNGCTVPVSYRVRSPLAVAGVVASEQVAVTNRCLSPPFEDPAAFMRPLTSLDANSVVDVLGLSVEQLQCLDFGTVTAPRVLTQGTLPLGHAIVHRRLQRAAATGAGIGADILAALATNGGVGAPHRLAEIAMASPANPTRFASAARALLGWDAERYPTVFSVAGTYLNAHLAILAGATNERSGGLLLLTYETGGNAPRAGWLRCPHFSCDLAGRPIPEDRETPMYPDGRTPGLTHTVALRDAHGRLRWGDGADAGSFAELIASELNAAVREATARNGAAPVRVVLYLPDRPKTNVLLTIEDFRSVNDLVAEIAARPEVGATYLFVDGCQTRGLTAQALMHAEGPVRWFEERGVDVAGVSWTTSKGPGGIPFAAGLTLTRAAFDDLGDAIETGEASSTVQPGFAARYVCDGDIPMAGKADVWPLLAARAVRDESHHLRLLGDLTRLWRWVHVNQEHAEAVAGARARLADELTGRDSPLHLMAEASDRSVINLQLGPAGAADPAIVALLLRWGFDVDAMPSVGDVSDFDRAAALLPTPCGIAVEEPTSSTRFDEPTDATMHPAIIRFAVSLELAELAAYEPAQFRRFVRNIGRLVRTRLQLIMCGYDDLAPALREADAAQAAAEAALYADRP